MDSLKRVRKKFLTCFRPPLSSADDGYNQQKRHPTDDGSNHNKIVTYVSLHDQDNNKMVLRKFITSVSDKNNKFKVSSGGDDDGDGGAACKKDKKSSRRAFSRAIKAVFFETSLAKKIRRRKNKKVAPASDSNRSSTSTGDSNVTSKKLHPELLISGDSNSSWSSLTYSSSSSSSFSSINPSTLLSSSSASSRRFSEQNRSFHAGLSYPPMNRSCHAGLSYPHMKEEDTRCPARGDGKKCNSNFGLCLILLCLLVLMTWGRVFAIFCTSTCLFMIPSYVYRKRIGVAPGQISRLPCFDSAAHKKRVIMEGWLERRRRVS